MVMHEVYLPFEETQLPQHFAPVAGGGAAVADRHLTYYRQSLDHHRRLSELLADGAVPTPAQVTRGQQLEKDERFWIVTALMSLYHARKEAAARRRLFATFLQRAGLAAPAPFTTWDDALDGTLLLYFEVNLPSPPSYKAWLADHLDSQNPIPHLHRAAVTAGTAVEGTTKADAVLLAPDNGVAVVFEAKVLSDLSTRIKFDIARNQLARIIDVTLDAHPHLYGRLGERRPERSCVVLVTPEVLHPRGSANEAYRSRLYGWLLPAYQDPRNPLLAHHLPHRPTTVLRGIPERLGWTTWEDLNHVLPGACPWLLTTSGSAGNR